MTPKLFTRDLYEFAKRFPRILCSLFMSVIRGGCYLTTVLTFSFLASMYVFPNQAEGILRLYEESMPFGNYVAVFKGFALATRSQLPESELPFQRWVHLQPEEPPRVGIWIGDTSFKTLQEAGRAASLGDTIEVGPGTYEQAIEIAADNVTLQGVGRVILKNTAAASKGAIVLYGNFGRIINIECSGISVFDGNGACVRLQGKHLRLENVYFHRSQSGLLADSDAGIVSIVDSRFELLGFGGRAHAIYTGKNSELHIERSLIIRSKGQGHEVKSRSLKTTISDSVIASLDGNDSRLIDISNGGEVEITNSVLAQGPQSENAEMIGIGLEGNLYESNHLIMRGNWILLERHGRDIFLKSNPSDYPTLIENNLFLPRLLPMTGSNSYCLSRSSCGLEKYPALVVPVREDSHR